MKYVLRLNDGYFAGDKPYTAATRQEATVFPTMKEARHTRNRLQDRLMKHAKVTIEPA